MPNKGGIVTRKDMFSDDAMNFGKDYAKQLETAIDANNVLIDSVKELNKQVQNFKGANNQKDYLSAKQAEALATQKATDAIKLKEAAEISALKIQNERIKASEIERKAIQSAADSEAKAQKVKESSVKLTIEERVQNEVNNKALRQAALEKLGLVSAYDKLNKARTEAKNNLRDLIVTEGENSKAVKIAQAEFDKLDEKVRKADAAVGDFSKNVGNYPTIGKLAGNLKDLAGAFGIAVGIGAFVTVMKDAYTTIKEFDQSIADLKAITGATGKDLEYLKSQAIELGKNVKGGAREVVEAYKLIASAKPELLNNVKALNQVTEATITLSKAAGMELPEAATALTDAMNQFGADASKATEFIDALANGAKYGSAEIPQITEALLKFGAVAKSSNINIQESTALIELLAEKGLKGAEAGTALRNVLLKLSAPDALPKDAQKIIKGLGIDFEFLKDKTVSVQQKFEALKPLLQNDAYLVKVFGQENIVAAKNVIGHTDRLGELTNKMGEFGTANEQAAERTKTLDGLMVNLSSSWDSFILSLNAGDSVISKTIGNLIGLLAKATEGYAFLLESEKQTSERMSASLYKQANEGMLNAIFEDSRKLSAQMRDLNDLILEQQAILQKSPNDAAAKSRIKSLNDQKDALKNLIDTENENIKLDAQYSIPGLQKNVDAIKAKIKALEEENIAHDKKVKSSFFVTASDYKALQAIEKNKKAINDLTVDLGLAEGDLDAYRSAYDQVNKVVEENTEVTKINLEDDKKAKEAKLKALADYFRKLQKMLKDSFDLEKFRLERTRELNQEIVDDEKKTIDERIEAMYNANQLAISLAETEAREKLTFLALEKDGLDKLSIAEQNAYLKSAKTKIETLLSGKVAVKDMTTAEILIYEQYQAKKEDIDKKIAQNKQKLIDAEVALVQKSIDAEVQKQEIELNNAIEAENRKFKILRDGILARGLLTDEENKLLEKATEDHERQVFEIQKHYTKKKLEEQINTLQKLLDNQSKLPANEQISAEERKKIEYELSQARRALSEADLTFFNDNTEKRLFFETESFKKIEEASQQLTDALQNLANALFENKIAKIDAEIAKTDAYYNRQLELAGNDQRQKDLIQDEANKKKEELEKKKRKEQHKQAVFNKALAITEAGINTAKAVTAALSAGPGVGLALAVITAAVAAIQLAAIIATPIPKYKDGRKDGPAEYAYVGDGGRSEVIEKKDGRAFLTPNKSTLTYLEAGDKVHSSVNDYMNLQRASMMASLNMQGRKMNDYQARQEFDNVYGKEMLEEMKATRKAIEKGKPIIIQNNIDIPHKIWASKNTNWS